MSSSGLEGWHGTFVPWEENSGGMAKVQHRQGGIPWNPIGFVDVKSIVDGINFMEHGIVEFTWLIVNSLWFC